jgi:hypothetical protein
MNRTQYEALLSENPGKAGVITLDHLVDRSPRTLMYGYTLERHDVHAYVGADNAITLLVYSKVSNDPETGASRYLILDHAGPSGRNFESNHEFLPSKRACPEVCDFEFCRLLRNQGLMPSYTTFTERSESEGEFFGPYAGVTADLSHALKGIPLDAAISAHPLYAELARSDRTLSSRLLIQAAQDMGIPAETYGGSAIVAEYGAGAVVKKALEYLEGIKVADMQSSSFTSRVITAVFGFGNYIVPSQPDLINGRISFSVDPENVPFKKNSKFTRYAGTCFEGAEAVIGEVEGMPFLAVSMSHNNVLLEVQQFGDRERRITQWVRMFSLTPVANKKAVKVAATQ